MLDQKNEITKNKKAKKNFKCLVKLVFGKFKTVTVTLTKITIKILNYFLYKGQISTQGCVG